MNDETAPIIGTPPTVDERREHRRVPAPYHAIVCNGEDMVAAAGRTENISASGCLMIIDKNEDFHLSGNDFFILISVPNEQGSGAHLEMHNCIITRVQRMESGEVTIGVRFTN